MAFANGYTYRRKITIDPTKVTTGGFDFQTMIKGTYTYLKSTANGGEVVNDSGYLDIRFESTDGTQLDHEIVRWEDDTGFLYAFVKVPSISASVDTDFYIYYGKTLTTQEDNPTGVWDGFASVVHMAPNYKQEATGGSVPTYQGIEYGYFTGALDFILNQFGGAANTGEIDFTSPSAAGTSFTKYDGTLIEPANPRSGIAMLEGAGNAREGFIMYTATSVHTRWGGFNGGHCDHFVFIYWTGSAWQYDNNTSMNTFTPVSTDVIVGRAQQGVVYAYNLEGGDSWDSTENNTVQFFDTGTDTTAAVWYRRASRNNVDSYGKMTGNATDWPSTEIGVSFWVRTTDTNAGIISYATSGNDNEFLLYLAGSEIQIHAQAITAVNSGYTSLNDGSWHHVCFRARASSGGYQLLVDGTVAASGSGFTGLNIRTGGTLIFFQEQDVVGGSFGTQSLGGDLENFRLHNDIDAPGISMAWAYTAYASENSPSTFYSVGAQEEFASAERDAETHGAVNDSNTRDGEIAGKDTGANERDAEILGGLLSTDTRDGETAGRDTANAERDAETTGSTTAAGEVNAQLYGEDTANAERDAEVSGIDTDNDTRDAETTGSLDVTAERGAEIEGVAFGDERSAEIEGDADNIEIRDAEVYGRDTANAERDAELTGSVDTSDSRDAELYGKASDVAERSAEVEGRLFATDEYDAELSGKDTANDSRDAELYAEANTAGEVNAELTGKARFLAKPRMKSSIGQALIRPFRAITGKMKKAGGNPRASTSNTPAARIKNIRDDKPRMKG